MSASARARCWRVWVGVESPIAFYVRFPVRAVWMCTVQLGHALWAVPGTAVAVQAVFSDCSEACKTSKAVLAPSIKPVAKHVKPVKPEDSKNSYN